MAIQRKDEVLDKALAADSSVIPRYDIVLPGGTKVAENAQVILKNPILQPGMPQNAAAWNEVLAASGTTTGTASSLVLAQPGFVLKDGAAVRVKLHVAIAGSITLNVNSTGAKALVMLNSDSVVNLSTGTLINAAYNTTIGKYVIQNISVGVQIGDVVSSTRTDFLSQVGTTYLSCNGQILDSTLYPMLSTVVPSALGLVWSDLNTLGYLTRDLIKLSSGKLMWATTTTSYSPYILVSSDGGVTWPLTSSYIGSARSLLLQLSTGRVLAFPTSDSVVYYTDDEAVNWTQTGNSPTATKFAEVAQNGWVYSVPYNGAYQTPKVSKDNGLTWSDVGANGPLEGGVIRRLRNGTMLQVMQNNVRKSTNNGETFTIIGTTGNAGLPEDLIELSNGMLIAAIGSGGGLITSDDGGVSWQKVSSSAGLGCYSLVQLTNGVILCGSGAGVLRSIDNGVTWDKSTTLADKLTQTIIETTPNVAVAGATDAFTGLKTSKDAILLPNIPKFYVRVK